MNPSLRWSLNAHGIFIRKVADMFRLLEPLQEVRKHKKAMAYSDDSALDSMRELSLAIDKAPVTTREAPSIPERTTSPSISSVDDHSSDTSAASTRSFLTSTTGPSCASSASSFAAVPPWHESAPTLGKLSMFGMGYGYDLPCEFAFMGCSVRFHPEPFEDWISHSLSHFAGVLPPNYSTCTFCEDGGTDFRSFADPEVSWRQRMIHIGSHFADCQLNDMRPDPWVIEYMWKNDLISDEDNMCFEANAKSAV